MNNNFDSIIERLKEGNKRFASDALENANCDKETRAHWEKTQEPKTIVLGCADSRVVPEHIFDMGVGELFTVRVAGNVANTESLASIEYAVAHLGSKVIVVLGHESCGAVGAAMKGGDNKYNLNMLLAQITPAVEACGSGADIMEVVKKNAQLVSEDLVNRSPIIRDAVSGENVKILPAYYNFVSGKVDFL